MNKINHNFITCIHPTGYEPSRVAVSSFYHHLHDTSLPSYLPLFLLYPSTSLSKWTVGSSVRCLDLKIRAILILKSPTLPTFFTACLYPFLSLCFSSCIYLLFQFYLCLRLFTDYRFYVYLAFCAYRHPPMYARRYHYPATAI